MGLIEQANKDIQDITSNPDEFGIAMTLQAPNGQKASLVGLHVKVHLGVNTEGEMVNTKQARVTISEQVILNANPNYPIRNAKGDVDLAGHIITAPDSTGTQITYTPESVVPDEAIGLLLITLSIYTANVENN